MGFDTNVILAASIALQFVAAFLAVRLIKTTKTRAWYLISTALVFMGLRRLVTLIGSFYPPVELIFKGLLAESIALLISILMVAGVFLIADFFRAKLRVEKALLESEKRYRDLFENANDAIYLIDPQTTKIIDCNKKAAEMDGYSTEELKKMTVFDLHPDDERDILPEKFREVLRKGSASGISGLHQLRKDGKLVPIEVNATMIKIGDKDLNLSIVRDVTERQRVVEELHRVNRALKTLSECNQAVVRATEESDLLHDICRIIVEVGGYRLAWVGFAEQDEEKTVSPVAQAGYEEGYLDTVHITWSDTERGRGPTGTAIRTGRPNICKNMLTDPKYAPWRDEATKRGYASSIALPLIADDQSFGALSVYAVEPDAFDTGEVKLLMELAEDLAYGIAALRARVERRRAEQELQKQHEEIKKLKEFNEKIVQSMQDGVVVEDRGGVITYLNPQAEKMLGYAKDELVGRHWSRIVSKRFLKKVEKETAQRPRGIASRYECEIVTKSGEVVPIINSATPLFEEGEFKGVLSVFTDISEQKEREEKLRKKLMKYRLDWGRTYYADESRVALAFDAFLDLISLGYPGAVIARLPPDEVRDKSQDRAPVLWLSEKAHKLSIAPEFRVLVDKIEDLLTMRKVILFQGLEYLISKHGYDNTLEFLQGLNELFYIEKGILLLSLDSKALSEQQFELLKKETHRLMLKREVEMPEKSLSLLRFVYKSNSAGVKPSHSEVCKHFEITRNTARARIKYLAARGLLTEKLKGRRKVLELTELGKDYL